MPVDDNPSIMSHVSIGVVDVKRATAFYDAVLAVLGAKRIVEHPGGVAYGKQYPEFWIGRPHDGKKPTAGNGVHFGFIANSREQVDAFHAAALKAGARDDGPPGPRADYGPEYYGCFVRDLDGHKIEATFMDWGAGAGDA